MGETVRYKQEHKNQLTSDYEGAQQKLVPNPQQPMDKLFPWEWEQPGQHWCTVQISSGWMAVMGKFLQGKVHQLINKIEILTN